MAPLQASDGCAAASDALQAARLQPACLFPSTKGSRKKDHRNPYSSVTLRRIFHESARYHSKSCQWTRAVTSMLFSETLKVCALAPVPGRRIFASGLPVLVPVHPVVGATQIPPSKGVMEGRSAPVPPSSILALVL